MTEAEWLACDNPIPMLEFNSGKASGRKFRLFSALCCHRIGHILTDVRSRAAVDVAERSADGLATDAERVVAETEAQQARQDAVRFRQENDAIPEMFILAAGAARAAVTDLVDYEAAAAVVSACRLIARNDTSELGSRESENHHYATTLRDIFGNPFRPVTLDSAWRTSTVVQLAQGIYDDRAFDRLPILADALQDAGCDNEDILDHCRGSGPHARGCWVVDLVLGKA